jgi:septal ring factor EnvC (AmiA/AmiB activator)
MQGRVFHQDMVDDAAELRDMVKCVQQEQARWDGLVELKAATAQQLNGEMDEQLRHIKQLTATQRRTRAALVEATATLEECRVKRVKAEQDHTDWLHFGNQRCANAGRVDAGSRFRAP